MIVVGDMMEDILQKYLEKEESKESQKKKVKKDLWIGLLYCRSLYIHSIVSQSREKYTYAAYAVRKSGMMKMESSGLSDCAISVSSSSVLSAQFIVLIAVNLSLLSAPLTLCLSVPFSVYLSVCHTPDPPLKTGMDCSGCKLASQRSGLTSSHQSRRHRHDAKATGDGGREGWI